MQSTTNYSMNLVEGTDIVNIPVQLNPNFQTIDQEMFANKQGSIGTATEVVTGTVHAVVRANTDADMFRFTATGAWTAGDTMTLDGSAVTVHLADGTAPATGAYIIGAEVVAVVNGSLVTLLTSAAQPPAGVNSFNTRTGAVVPTASDYDASMIDYDNTSSGLTSTDVQSAIDELKTATQHGVIEVWENANIAVSFDPQTITVTGGTAYDGIVIVNSQNPSESTMANWCEFDSPSGSTAIQTTGMGRAAGSDVIYLFDRAYSFSVSGSDVIISIGNCTVYENNRGTLTSTTNNNFNIPVRILGLIHNN